MNDQIRGTRTRGHENSDQPTDGNGTPSFTDDTLNDDPADQNSEGETKAKGEKQTTDEASTNSEHPEGKGSSSNQYGHSPEEAAEYEKLQKDLANARERKKDADRKITEQGQANSELQKKVEKLTGEVENLKTQRAELLTGGPRQNNSAALFGGDDFDIEDGEKQGLSTEEKLMYLENYVHKLGDSHTNLVNRHTNAENRQMYEEDLRDIQEYLGVDRDAASTLQDAFDQGDIVGFVKGYELTSLPKQARETLRTERERRRSSAAVGHPGTQTSTYIPSEAGDDDTRNKIVRDIDKMTNPRAKQHAIQKALDEDPGMYPFFANLLKESGYNVS